VLLLLCCSYEVDIYEGRQWVGGKVASFQDKDGNHIEVRQAAAAAAVAAAAAAATAATQH
jgi:hypothetical protein